MGKSLNKILTKKYFDMSRNEPNVPYTARSPLKISCTHLHDFGWWCDYPLSSVPVSHLVRRGGGRVVLVVTGAERVAAVDGGHV